MLVRVAVAVSLSCSVAAAQEAGQKAQAAYQHFYCHHIIPLMANADGANLFEQHENHVWAASEKPAK